jgi:hypothetical protein
MFHALIQGSRELILGVLNPLPLKAERYARDGVTKRTETRAMGNLQGPSLEFFSNGVSLHQGS